MKLKLRTHRPSFGNNNSRNIVVTAILAALLARPASAARVQWSHGGTNLALTAAQRCTLDVVFTPEETVSLREWRLVWAANSATSPPLRALVSGGSVLAREACDVRQDRDGNQGARVDTAYFCSSTGTVASPLSVRYVLDVPSPACTRIAVIPILKSERYNSCGHAGDWRSLHQWWYRFQLAARARQR